MKRVVQESGLIIKTLHFCIHDYNDFQDDSDQSAKIRVGIVGPVIL